MTQQNVQGTSTDFEDLLLRAHPETALTQEIGSQLREFLPYRSLDQLKQKLNGRELTVGGYPLSPEAIGTYLPNAVFPIDSEEDLATTLTAAVRTAVSVAGQSKGVALHDGNSHQGLLSSPKTNKDTEAGHLQGSSVLEGGVTGDTDQLGAWLVTLVIHDCGTGNLLPGTWITDFVSTYVTNAWGRFTVVIDAYWEVLPVFLMRDGYINKIIYLTQSTMAGTVQDFCLNHA